MLDPVLGFHAFLRVPSVPLFAVVNCILCIRPPGDGCLGCFILAPGKNIAVTVGVQMCVSVPFQLLDTHLGVASSGHMIAP